MTVYTQQGGLGGGDRIQNISIKNIAKLHHSLTFYHVLSIDALGFPHL